MNEKVYRASSLYDAMKLAILVISRGQNYITLLACMVLIIFLNSGSQVSKTIKDNASSLIKNGYVTIVTPVVSLSKGMDWVTEYLAAVSKNRELKIKLEKLSRENFFMQLEVEAAKKLKQSVNLMEGASKDTITARLFSVHSGALSKTLTLAVGSNIGIKIGDVVYSNNHLVGKVVLVQHDTAVIRSIMDHNSKIPAITMKGGQRMIVQGAELGGLLPAVLYNSVILPEAEDLVITSGDGGIYPYGLIIGKVKLKGDKVMVQPNPEVFNVTYVTVLMK